MSGCHTKLELKDEKLSYIRCLRICARKWSCPIFVTCCFVEGT